MGLCYDVGFANVFAKHEAVGMGSLFLCKRHSRKGEGRSDPFVIKLGMFEHG